MENTEILHKVEEVFRDVLDDEEIALTMATTANDIEDWDSLTHVELVRGFWHKIYLGRNIDLEERG